MLAQPAVTRWGSLGQCFKTLLAAERILHETVSDRGWAVGNSKKTKRRQRMKDIITDSCFIDNLNKCIAILKPIDMFITQFQSDTKPLSDVFHAFRVVLSREFHKLEDTKVIDKSESEYIRDLLISRFNFMHSTAHAVSYVLDPRYIGDAISPERRASMEHLLYVQAASKALPGSDLNAAQEDVYAQYTEFKNSWRRVRELAAAGTPSIPFNALMNGKVTVLQWWKNEGENWPLLQPTAIQVFSLAPSSAASERNFSTFGFIHSKLRNSLSPDKVRKLVYIKTNCRQLERTNPKIDYESDESDEEDGENSGSESDNMSVED